MTGQLWFKVFLECDLQLQRSTSFREEPKIIEQWNEDRERKISQDQILGEGEYATIEKQVVYQMTAPWIFACSSFEFLGQS